MKILILEDEPPIAEHIAWMCSQILQERMESCTIYHTLQEALAHIQSHTIDLLLLDINLEGENGFNILKQTVAESFHTIIISAHLDQAVTAFQYGVLDFIPKPFNEDRLRKGLERYANRFINRELDTRYLAVRESEGIHLVEIEKIQFIKAVGNYSEAVLHDGSIYLIVKSLSSLEKILPQNFQRIHKSYILNIVTIHSYLHAGGGTYQVLLNSGRKLPLSRNQYKIFQERFNPKKR